MKLFNQIVLQTPESVEIEFTLAGIGNRIYAVLIDYLILSFIWIGIQLNWLSLASFLINLFLKVPAPNEYIRLWLIAIVSLIIFFIYIGYFVVFEVLWQGQTPGKRLMKIRVIRDDGRRCGILQATLRALLRPVDDILFMGVLFIIIGQREKRIGDYVAGTVVIQEAQPIASANFTISKQAKSLAKQLLKLADFSSLLPDDFAVLREYLQRRQHMTTKGRSELCQHLAPRIKKAIALEKMPQKVTAEVFLAAVYLAYQQQSSPFDRDNG